MDDSVDEYEDDDGDSVETVTCPNCRAAVYEDAEACPRCGEYIIRGGRAGHPRWVTIAAVVLLLALAFGWLLHRKIRG